MGGLLSGSSKLAEKLKKAKENSVDDKKKKELVRRAEKACSDTENLFGKYADYIKDNDIEGLQKILDLVKVQKDSEDIISLRESVKTLEEETHVMASLWESNKYSDDWQRNAFPKKEFTAPSSVELKAAEEKVEEKVEGKVSKFHIPKNEETSNPEPIQKAPKIQQKKEEVERTEKSEKAVKPEKQDKKKDVINFKIPVDNIRKDNMHLHGKVFDTIEEKVFDWQRNHKVKVNRRSFYNLGAYLVSKMSLEEFEQKFKLMIRDLDNETPYC